MTVNRTATQRGLGAAGKRLWDNVIESFALEVHEEALLREACRTVDTINQLQREIDRDGVTTHTGFETKRIHPALIEIRQQRITLTRIVAALGLPQGLEDGEPVDAPAKRAKPKRGSHPLRGLRSL